MIDRDVAALPFMPLFVDKLLASDTWSMANGDEAKAAVTLWARAWKQVPAGSLPKDDKVLAGLSGAGAKWPKVREVALRGFVLGDDGRLHHELIEQAADDALAKLAGQRTRTAAATAKRQEQRQKVRHEQRDDQRNDAPEPQRNVVQRERELQQPPTVPPPSATEPPGEERVARKRAPATPKPAVKTSLPADFAISDRVRAWAADKGHARLEERCEHFIGKAKANGYRYADWDEAFMTAIRDDWAKLDGKPAAGAVSRLTPAGQQTAAALQRWMETSEAKDGTTGP